MELLAVTFTPADAADFTTATALNVITVQPILSVSSPAHVQPARGFAGLRGVSVSDQHTSPNLQVQPSTTAGRLQVGRFRGVTITGNRSPNVNLHGTPAAVNRVLAGLSLSLRRGRKASVTVTGIDGSDTDSSTITVS